MAKCCGTKGDGWFGDMLDHCLSYATAAKAAGRPVIGILCEYTPRELILAAGGVPVCLCGGSAKTIPAAEEHLPANLCPLIKSTYGFHLQRSNPFLEMADLVVGETTCDGKKKMYELMAESRPMYILELPQKPDDADALAHWFRELAKFRDFSGKGSNAKIRRRRPPRGHRCDEPRAGPPPRVGRVDAVRASPVDRASIAGFQKQHFSHPRRLGAISREALAGFRRENGRGNNRCDLAGRVRVLDDRRPAGAWRRTGVGNH